MTWHDVSIPLHAGVTVWPGDPPFEMAPAQRIASGAGCNTSLLRLSTHTGTHCDAPWHFEEDGPRLHEVKPDVFFGKALLIDLPHVDVIGAADLPAEQLPARVLFKTRNSDHAADAPFRQDYVALAADAAAREVITTTPAPKSSEKMVIIFCSNSTWLRNHCTRSAALISPRSRRSRISICASVVSSGGGGAGS